MQKESQRHNDKGRAKTSLEKYVPLTLLKGFEEGYSRFYCERELETEQNCNILTPILMAVSVVSCSFSMAAQPEAQGPSFLLHDGFLYCILSPTGLQSSMGVPRVPSAGCGFPYHILSPRSLIPNSSGPQGPSPPGFLYHILSATSLDPNSLTSCLHRVI